MAEEEVAEEEEEDSPTVLVEVEVVASDNGACSVILGGWELMLSDESVGRN